MDLEQINPKKSSTFSCETCNYYTSSRKDFNKHESTRKHLDAVASNQNEPIYPQKSPQHICKQCNKEYKSRSGLWNHLKKCSSSENSNTMVPVLNNTMIFDLIRQNQEFKELLVEQNKKIMELLWEDRRASDRDERLRLYEVNAE
jgi:ribosomal protein L37AE/L43A